jgi:hypothetical protein
MRFPPLKLLIILVVFSTFGFMLKLPSVFRNIDTELHFLFYFCASLILNLLWQKEKFIFHMLIFIVLFSFGVGIEIAQDLSNHFFTKKIHGNFDKRDIMFNTLGLICASCFWVFYLYLRKILGEKSSGKTEDSSRLSL